MITERTQWSAVPVGGWERVTGYIIGPTHKHLNVIDEDGEGYIVIIHPDTIEPVRVKPIRVKWEFAWKEGQYRHYCPNCEPNCEVVKDESKLEYCLEHFGQPDYCPWCGQALDWSNE